jgi:hypothetical protein
MKLYKLPATIDMNGIVRVTEISSLGTLQVYCNSWNNYLWKQAQPGQTFFASTTTDDVGKIIILGVPDFLRLVFSCEWVECAICGAVDW